MRQHSEHWKQSFGCFYSTYFILEKGNLKLVKNNKAKTILANQAKGGFS